MKCPAGCQPGQRIKNMTTCECVPCAPHTYMEEVNFNTYCNRCQVCKRKEKTVVNCSTTTRAVCRCIGNSVYDPQRSCRPCQKGLISRKNKCVNATVPIDPGGGNEDSASSADMQIVLGIIIGFGFVLVICVIIGLVICYYRKRKRRRTQIQKTPDLILEAEGNKTPPLPPKKYVEVRNNGERHGSRCRRQISGNAYVPMPQINQNRNLRSNAPLLPVKLSMIALPFSFIQEMSQLLNASYLINYKHLAIELNFDIRALKLLENDPRPVETLLDHFVTSVNPTRERLYEACVAIGRIDVADLVWKLQLKEKT